MTDLSWFLLLLALAVFLDIGLVWVRQRYRRFSQQQKQQAEKNQIQHRRLLMKSIFPNQLIKGWSKLRSHQKYWEVFQTVLEFILIGVWAYWVGREYLDFNPNVVPAGREFGSAIQTHHLWTRFRTCGWCALWNGSERGGYPAFVDIHGSMLHPIVMITTLLWGVVNGAKIALMISFWFSGVAQWWLAKELRLGWLPRLWSAGMAVVGGHLTGRMELGAFGVVLSMAMSSLVLAGILAVAQRRNRRSAIILGIVTASAILSGQGYIQVGLLGILPAFVLLLFDKKTGLKPIWKYYLLALVLALLLSAVFLIPFAHFSPNFLKDTDPEFKTAQSLNYLPLNLVIRDWEFYHNETLGKYPYPHLYALYIGWIPVILAIVGISMSRSEDRHLTWFMIVGALLEFMIGSAVLLKLAAKVIPPVSGIRHPSQIAGLAVPLILGLSAYGLDRLLKIDWPNLTLSSSNADWSFNWRISLQWFLLIPLLFSLRNGYDFSTYWLYSKELGEEIDKILMELETDSLQWVEPPFGEHAYIEPAIRKGLKLSPGIMAWRWKDREFPIPVLEANRKGPPSDLAEFVTEVDGVQIYARDDQPYAAVLKNDEWHVCNAYGTGGYLTVYCDKPFSGSLVVKENMWTGWKAWRDGERIALRGEQWLEVNAPAGKHTYQFRYRPWDVPIGLTLSVLGMIFCGWLWLASPNGEQVVEPLHGPEE